MDMSEWMDAPKDVSILIERHEELGKIVIDIFLNGEWQESHVMHWTESKTIKFEFEEQPKKGLLGPLEG